MSSIKLEFEINPDAHHARTSDIESAVNGLVASMLFLARCFGVRGVSVTISRGDDDE